MIFNPGQCNRRISFLERGTGKDDYGDPATTWSVFKSAWARKEDPIGSEFYSSLTSDVHVDTKFECRYVSGITKDMRIQHGTDIYEILGVPVDVGNLHRSLLCYCRMVV